MYMTAVTELKHLMHVPATGTGTLLMKRSS